MQPRSPLRRLLGQALGVVLLLLLFDWWVQSAFFESEILPRYATSHAIMRDRSGGRHIGILFDSLRQETPTGARIAMIGDSTMNSADGSELTIIPYLLGQRLHQEERWKNVETVDCSIIGQYASDALLFLSKVLTKRFDVVVYGVALRALPHSPETQWVSRVKDEMGIAEFSRIVQSGGGRWLMQTQGIDQILTSLVHVHWSAYAYRSELRRALSVRALQPLVETFPALLPIAGPTPQPSPVSAPRPLGVEGSYEWSRRTYGPPSVNWEAIEIFGRLCQRYAPGRCVIYAGPINPLGRDSLVEASLYNEYLAHLRITAGRYGLIWRDFTDALTPAEFIRPKYGGLRDPIHPNEQGRHKLAELLVAPVVEALSAVSAPPGSVASITK